MYPLLKRVILSLSAITLLVVAGCGGTTTTTAPAGEGGVFTFGEPADPAQADRKIEILASDNLTFDPSAVEVTAGEVITFRVANHGQIPHDFTLGDEATQNEHEEEMAEMGGMTMPDQANAMVIPAGETKELTWRFTTSGTVIFGCHQPGHYAGGMRGEIIVES